MLLQRLFLLDRELLFKKNSGRTIDLDEDREPHDNIETELERDQGSHQDVDSNPIIKKHRLFVDLVGFAISLRDIMDFS